MCKSTLPSLHKTEEANFSFFFPPAPHIFLNFFLVMGKGCLEVVYKYLNMSIEWDAEN